MTKEQRPLPVAGQRSREHRARSEEKEMMIEEGNNG
jgi:hypothetical protein